jgi:phage recombination protein Bet
VTTTEQSLARSEDPNNKKRAITLQQVMELTGYDVAQIALIRNSVAQGASLEELAVFLHAARTLQLDPLLRQVYWIRRQGKGTLQVGIDGFRSVADRTNLYAGSEPPRFNSAIEVPYKGGKFLAPERAQITVWKIVGGQKCPFTGEARWTEFYPGEGADGFMYRKMPFHMLAKDAEAQALRKAFPAQLGGVQYVSDAALEAGPRIVVEERGDADKVARDAAMYDRIYGSDAEPGSAFADMPSNHATTPQSGPVDEDGPPDGQEAESTRSALVASYRTLLADAARKLGPAFSESEWLLAEDASDDEIEAKGVALSDLLTRTAPKSSRLLDEALKKNAALLADAEQVGVRGLRLLKATSSDSLDILIKKNREIGQRLRSRAGETESDDAQQGAF